MNRSKKQLAKIEKECGIAKRWDWSSNAAKAIAIDIIETERGELIESLRTLAHKRKFLLQMKNLYASKCHRPNWLRFLLPISSYVTILLGSFSIMLRFALMAQLCMA